MSQAVSSCNGPITLFTGKDTLLATGIMASPGQYQSGFNSDRNVKQLSYQVMSDQFEAVLINTMPVHIESGHSPGHTVLPAARNSDSLNY